MDTQTLKVFAERLRAHLATQHLPLKHGQALELVSAIPGLRTWSEVTAFPDRVTASAFNDDALGRLARRIDDKFSLSLSTEALRQALTPKTGASLKVWPDGPVPGVFITTSERAIDAAIANYDAATDGAILYAEEAGSGSASAIELGEMGLFSGGMERLPSGTLIVVGPVELTQDGWEDSRNRLNVAANLAYSHSLRIVVLARTPLPKNLHSDIDLLLRPEGESLDTPAVDTLGIVTDAGELQVVMPFVAKRARPIAAETTATAQRLPAGLELALSKALTVRPFGIVLFGVSAAEQPVRMDIVEALLPLTDHAGPAVRIQDHFRSSDKPMSPAVDALPVYPSVESAHAHGFRRMVIGSAYGNAFTPMLPHCDDTCFIGVTQDAETSGMWVRSAIPRARSTEYLRATIAVMCVTEVTAKGGSILISDAITADAISGRSDTELDEMFAFFDANRAVRWEDQLEELLNAGRVSIPQARKALRFYGIEDFLSARRTAKSR